MGKIEDAKTMQQAIREQMVSMMAEIANGNPGALSAAIAMNNVSYRLGQKAIARAYQIGLKGAKLYQLWNDCFNRDSECTLLALAFCDERFLKEISGMYPEAGRGKKDSHIVISLDGENGIHFPKVEVQVVWETHPGEATK